MRWAAAGGAGILLLALLSAARSAAACAGCRNPSMSSSRGSEGPLPERAVRVGASLTGTTVHVVHESGCRDTLNCSEVPVQELYLHDQRLYPVELRLTAEYGISETFGLELQVPFRSVTTSVEFTRPNGSPYQPLDADVHHRDETLVGPADSWLLLRIGTVFQGWWLAARPGVSLPLGRTEEDPFELGDSGLRHQHIQLGSGTLDPVLVVEASRKLGELELGIFAQAQASLYENRHGYRAPWKVNGAPRWAASSSETLGARWVWKRFTRTPNAGRVRFVRTATWAVPSFWAP